MRTFQDDEGQSWIASVRERTGRDYKGRYWLVMVPEGAAVEEGVELTDVRWNSARTADRTLETMSKKELRRRLRSASARAI